MPCTPTADLRNIILAATSLGAHEEMHKLRDS